ncbi:hypothetical protein FNV43_RR25501 [Rhamnella rubrinervis]|uniref:Nuclear pore complex protein NUP1-like n=1 Tax=Rhamnella rubrinervis TaxID=2594499 RepID=A0A8K0GRN8_9ROSA|nr:hypothetical protein FNV43_RR25501 [Rhamnella rubrinervis]
METARDERQPYEGGGLGTGGKFRKKPFRKTTHSTPYDRPPTALRNPTGGWLSKLVDPAHRLITSSAHRFFSTFLRKRLPPPEAPATEANYEARNKQQEADAPDTPGEQREAVEQIDSPSKCANGGGLNDLEQILKQKTFSRQVFVCFVIAVEALFLSIVLHGYSKSEIDHLTALLHSRTVDTLIVNQEKRSEIIPLKSFMSHDRQDTLTKIPAQTNGIESHLVSTPAVGSSVLDEDVASPAELAKAYMGGRPSKVTPSKLGFRSQVFGENSAVLSSLPSKLLVTPVVPKTSSRAEAPLNGFITPRSRGRSAIYSMARTPYSRVHQTTLKGVGSAVNAYDGPSSSQSVREQSLFSASKQGSLKRRSSVLDNEIGSFGPIRSIRQKQSFLSSRGLSSPVSGNIPISGGGLGSETSKKPSSMQKLNSFENGANTVPGSSFSSVPSKSSEMASKILQQLDKLVSPKDKSSESKVLTLMDKSPTKLSSSMLHGQALKSLEAVDSSKFLGNVQDNSKLDGLVDNAIPDALDVASLKQDMVRENGPLKIVAPCDKATVVNGVDSAVPKKDMLPSVENTVSATPISVAYPPQKKRAFKMSAHEDSLELDDDGYCNGTALYSLTEGVQEVDTSLAKRKSPVTEDVRLEKLPAFLDGKASTSAMNKKPDLRNSDGSVHGEKNSNFIISSTSSPSTMVFSTVEATQSSLTSDRASPPKESNAALPMFSFGSKAIDRVPQSSLAFGFSPSVVAQSAGTSFGSFSCSVPEASSSLSTVPAGGIDSVLKVPESEKVGINNISNAGVSFRTLETVLPSSLSSSTSTTTTFSFGTPPNNSTLNNGSLASTSTTFVVSSLASQGSSNSSSFTSTVNSIPTTSITTDSTKVATSGIISTSTPAPSFPAVSVFKFGSSTASNAVPPVSAMSDLPSPETTPKQETSFGTLSSTTLSDTAAATANSGSSIFGFSTSTADNQTQGSTFLAASGSMPISQASSAGTGISTFTQSMPLQFGSSTPSPSFGLTGTSTLASGNSISGSTAAKLFTTGTSGLGSSASLSETNSIGSSSGTTSSLFGTSWQPAKSSVFVSTFNSTSPSTGFSFGASAASSDPTNSLPIVFGASTASAGTKNSVPAVFGSSNGSSASSIFSFTSPSTTASTPPVFGNSNSVFAFGSATSANNDQMNMEDSMAEDTVAAAVPSVPVFGQQTVPASTSGYVFGSASPSIGNPFTFGSQPNLAAAQNPSPFQASGSLGFIADGSNFSMGSGGGGGGDKNNRRIIRVKHNRPRKK